MNATDQRALFARDFRKILYKYLRSGRDIIRSSAFGRISNVILAALIILQVALVAYASFHHPPEFFFDEEFTVRVARQQPADIVEIVSHEQNFPAYHLLVHWLMTLPFDDIKTIRIFQFSVWIVGVGMFLSILRLLRATPRQQLSFVLLYVCSYGISMYAGYIRMYGLLTLLFLLAVYFFMRYTYSRKTIDAMLSGLWILLLAPLHPIAIIIIAVFFYTGIFVVKDRTPRFLLAGELAIAANVILINLLYKQRSLISLYVSDGVRYLDELGAQRGLYEFPQLLFFRESFSDSWVLFFLVGYLCYRFICHDRIQDDISFIIKIFFIAVAANIFLSRRINIDHHVVFLAPMLLLVLLRGYQTLSGFRRAVVMVSLVSYFLLISIRQYTGQINRDTFFSGLCNTLSTLPPGPVVTNHISMSVLIYCLSSDTHALYMETMDGHFKSWENPLFSKELLIEQAMISGSFYVGGSSVGYHEYLRNNASQLQEDLAKLDEFYFILFSSPVLYSDELELLTANHTYTDTLPGFVHVFTRKGPADDP